MKIAATITADGQPVPGLSIAAGETLEEPIAWENANGTPRNMDGATVTAALLDPFTSTPVSEGISYAEFVDESGTAERRLLLTRAASSALRPGRQYRIRITEVRAAPEPDTVSSAELQLEVT